jgi:hypothetical protein
MPVRYDIAAQVPQASAGPDIMNMMAQYQAMGYRQQQNALAQMQMQKMQSDLQQQSALRGIISRPGFNLNTPEATQALLGAGLFDEPLKLQAAQDTRALHQAAQRNYESEIKSRTGLTLAQIDKYGAETEKEAAMARKASLEASAAQLARAQEGASLVLGQGGRGFDKWRNSLPEELQSVAPEVYDPDQMSAFSTTLATHQEKLKNVNQFDYQTIKRGNKTVIVAIPRSAPERGATEIGGTTGEEEIKYSDLPVTDSSGNTRYVRVPQNVAQPTAVPILGTEGQKPRQLSFSPGPQGTGAMFVGDPSTGTGNYFYPGQNSFGGLVNDMGTAPTRNAFAAQPPALAAPLATAPAAPQGMVGIRGRVSAQPTPTAPLGSTERGRQDVMQQVLQAGGYNPDTGVDIVEPLLSRASSGMLSAKGTDIGRMFGANSAAAQADTELKRVSADLTQAFAGNRLATAGVAASEADRFEKQAADIGNPNLTIGERLAAYRGIKRNATRLLGSQYINPFDKSGMTQETMIRARVEETPEGEFTVPDPDGGVHRFGTRKQAAEFLSYVQRMTLGKR